MIRNALIKDCKDIQDIVNVFAKRAEMLPLSLNDVYEKIYEFAVYTESDKIVGVAALHPMWGDTAEIRSIAIVEDYQRKGVGSKLLEYQLARAKEIGFKSVFALTYREDFFIAHGFRLIDIDKLPKKIWTDCLKCIKFPNCDETAVIRDL